MPKPAPKKTIGVDIDDVIVAEAEYIIEYSNKHWGHSLSLEDYKEHWSDMWGISHEETEERANVLHLPGLTKKYKMLENAQESLEKLAKKYRLVVLTSRRRVNEEETLTWLHEAFGGIFEEVHFTGFWDTVRPESHLMTKAGLANQLGVDYLIDDQSKHCFAAAGAGIESILFGDFAESRYLDLPKGVTRCKNWQEVLEYFERRS